MVQPVQILLHEKGIAHQVIEVNPYDKPDWFRALSPTGQGLLPLLEVDGEVLFESVVINEFLDEAYGGPSLLPKDPVLRAKNRAWALQAFDVLMAMGGVMSVRRFEEYEGARNGLIAKLARLEAQLRDGPYFNGPHVALIDFQYAAVLLRIDILDRIYKTDVLPTFPKLSTWTKVLKERASVKASMPRGPAGQSFDDTFLAAFLDTYLSKQRGGGLTLSRS